MFAETFKFYKSKQCPPSLVDVLDFDNPDKIELTEIKLCPTDSVKNLPTGLIPISKWRCYEVKQRPGLIFVRNPFTGKGQRYWISRALRDYTKAPNVVNLNKHIFNEDIRGNWWKYIHSTKDTHERNKLKNSMRWATVGYHHDWDTKIYSEEMKNDFPEDLKGLCSFFAKTLKFGKYSAEAAIVNFYPIGTTLAGHTDHSESDLEAPLFSLSFGQTAIFLIGGSTKEEKPTALFLKSGDIVIMSKESRLCYHAVPKIMKSSTEPWNEFDDDEQVNSDDCDYAHMTKKLKRSQSSEACELGDLNEQLWKHCSDANFWHDFNEYLKDSRINMNVRQVLKEGQNKV